MNHRARFAILLGVLGIVSCKPSERNTEESLSTLNKTSKNQYAGRYNCNAESIKSKNRMLFSLEEGDFSAGKTVEARLLQTETNSKTGGSISIERLVSLQLKTSVTNTTKRFEWERLNPDDQFYTLQLWFMDDNQRPKELRGLQRILALAVFDDSRQNTPMMSGWCKGN